MKQTYYKKIKTAAGELTIIASDKKLLSCSWNNADDFEFFKPSKVTKHSVIDKTEKQLKEYFNGQRKEFDLPLEFYGTDFQVKVWKGLCTIPFGKTVSYKWLAKKIGAEKAVRAVGSANGKNRMPIIVPCHRVIAADGKLGGFSSGLDNKRLLLSLESPLELRQYAKN